MPLPLLSSCDSAQSLVSIRHGAKLAPDPGEIHSLGPAFKVVLILAFGSIFWLKKKKKREKTDLVGRGEGAHPEKAAEASLGGLLVTCTLGTKVSPPPNGLR